MGSLIAVSGSRTPGMSALSDPRQFNFGGFGTVSATYGTLIVLAISFGVAAIGALLYYGLLSMREKRISSSQHYSRILEKSTRLDEAAQVFEHLQRQSADYELR